MQWEEAETVANQGFNPGALPDNAVSVSTKNNYIRIPRKLAENFDDVELVKLVRGEGFIGLILGEGDRKLNWQNNAAVVSLPKTAQQELDFEGTKRFSAEIGEQIYEGKEITALTIDIETEK